MVEIHQNKDTTSAKVDNMSDAPPDYTPRTVPLPATPPPREYPPPLELPPDRIHAPGPTFSQDLRQLKDIPANVICPRCHYGVQTQIRSVCGTHAGVWSLIGCLICGVIGAILPLVLPSCQDIEHTCPHCGFLMARYRRGVDDTLVFPVAGPVGPNGHDYQPIPPQLLHPQHSPYTDNPKN